MEPNELTAAAGRYRDMIYRVALHWCGHPQEAEDATQDTLLKLCTTHRHFADEEHLRGRRAVWAERAGRRLAGKGSERRKF